MPTPEPMTPSPAVRDAAKVREALVAVLMERHGAEVALADALSVPLWTGNPDDTHEALANRIADALLGSRPAAPSGERYTNDDFRADLAQGLREHRERQIAELRARVLDNACPECGHSAYGHSEDYNDGCNEPHCTCGLNGRDCYAKIDKSAQVDALIEAARAAAAPTAGTGSEGVSAARMVERARGAIERAWMDPSLPNNVSAARMKLAAFDALDTLAATYYEEAR